MFFKIMVCIKVAIIGVLYCGEADHPIYHIIIIIIIIDIIVLIIKR